MEVSILSMAIDQVCLAIKETTLLLLTNSSICIKQIKQKLIVCTNLAQKVLQKVRNE